MKIEHSLYTKLSKTSYLTIVTQTIDCMCALSQFPQPHINITNTNNTPKQESIDPSTAKTDLNYPFLNLL